MRFAHVADGDTFTTRDLHPRAAAALDATTDHYRLASLRYDLSTLRGRASSTYHILACETPSEELPLPEEHG